MNMRPPMPRSDTHYHIDQAPDPHAVLFLAESARIRLVAPSMDVESYRTIRELQRLSTAIHKVGIGLHPERKHTAADLKQVARLAEGADAIGEVGLPSYDRRPTPMDIELFRTLCRMAVNLNKPLLVHAVHDSAPRALEVMVQEGVRRAIFHWLKADEAWVREIVAQGYFVSVTPEVTYRERDQKLVRLVPPDQLLIETDGPYPHGGPYAQRMTVPNWIDDAAAWVASFYGISVEEWWILHERSVARLFETD